MSKATILIVEDEAIVAKDLSEQLTRLGYQVLGITGAGEGAVTLARQQRPDAILMDIRLKGHMDGIQAAEQIRRDGNAPVIYLTAHSDSATLRRAKLTGPFGFILKPFDERELETQIEIALYRHQAERTLRESEEQFRAFFHTLAVGTAQLGLDGRLLEVNERLSHITGYTREELLRMTPADLTHPEDRQREDQALSAYLAGQAPAYHAQKRYLRKDGETVWVEVTAAMIRDAAGKPLRSAGVVQDITARKHAEETLRQTTEELKRSNRDLEQFASVASHDLQEPLRAVGGHARLLQRALGDKLEGKHLEYLTGAIEGAERMEQLIQDLLAFSRVGTREGARAPADLNELVRQAQRNLQATIKSAGAKLTTKGLTTLVVDAAQIAQLFQNLIVNAIKFCRTSQPKIEVGARQEPGRWVISVWDNGIGISPEHFERIFQIFQRLHTRKHYPGTGIGLAICQRIVERHGGAIWVESQPGQGSTFFFSIPEGASGPVGSRSRSG